MRKYVFMQIMPMMLISPGVRKRKKNNPNWKVRNELMSKDVSKHVVKSKQNLCNNKYC